MDWEQHGGQQRQRNDGSRRQYRQAAEQWCHRQTFVSGAHNRGNDVPGAYTRIDRMMGV